MGNIMSALRPIAFFRELFNERNGEGLTCTEDNHDESVCVKSVKLTFDTKSARLDLTRQQVLNEDLFYKALSMYENPMELKELILRNKPKLTTIPVMIGQFDNLVSLNLSNNSLMELPWSVLYLSKLEKLDLSHNCFRHIPRIIGYLKELKELSFNNNQLYTLPNELLKLEKLRKIDLSGNEKLTGVSPDQMKKGVSAIFELIRKRQERSDLWAQSTPWIGFRESVTYGNEPQLLHEIAVESILSHKVNFLVFDHVPPRLKTMLNERADEYRNRIQVAKCSKCKYFYSTKEMFENHLCVSA